MEMGWIAQMYGAQEDNKRPWMLLSERVLVLLQKQSEVLKSFKWVYQLAIAE